MPSKSEKQKSEALAKARKALRQFSGKLANPILVEQGPGIFRRVSLQMLCAAMIRFPPSP
jgi:hypothetical protein